MLVEVDGVEKETYVNNITIINKKNNRKSNKIKKNFLQQNSLKKIINFYGPA